MFSDLFLKHTVLTEQAQFHSEYDPRKRGFGCDVLKQDMIGRKDLDSNCVWKARHEVAP